MVTIDARNIVRGGEWDNHSVCKVPSEYLLCLTDNSLTTNESAKRAAEELSDRGVDL